MCSKHPLVLEINQSNDVRQDGKYKPVKHIHAQRLKTLHSHTSQSCQQPLPGRLLCPRRHVKVFNNVSKTCRLHENISISWYCRVVQAAGAVIISRSNGPPWSPMVPHGPPWSPIHRLHGGLSTGIVCQPLLQLVFRDESPPVHRVATQLPIFALPRNIIDPSRGHFNLEDDSPNNSIVDDVWGWGTRPAIFFDLLDTSNW